MADWPILVLVGWGAATGRLAGAALGLVLGGWLESLDGQPISNRLMPAMVRRQRLGMDRRGLGLAVTGRRTAGSSGSQSSTPTTVPPSWSGRAMPTARSGGAS
jgi:hypothetical protein